MRHATERWKPIHKPDENGLPGYLLKYDESLLQRISEVFHQLLHRNFKKTCVGVGEFLKDSNCKEKVKITEKKSKGVEDGAAAAAGGGGGGGGNGGGGSGGGKQQHAVAVVRTYGVGDRNYPQTIAAAVAAAESIATRLVHQGDESMPPTCAKTGDLIKVRAQ